MSPTAMLRTWAGMVKLAHTVFALPFALSGAALAATEHGIGWTEIGWILVAMFAARNAAMGFNRLVDEPFDARNPRTADRELPAGRLSRGAVWAVTAALAVLFVFASFRLNRLCGLLSFPALVVTLGYSFTKRFTWASHLVLGLALALAPIGGYAAVAGRLSPAIGWMAAGVLLWVAGFDVVYACQDADFDRGAGLRSIPARFGLKGALRAARLFHVLALAALAAVGPAAGLHPAYWFGIAVIAALLVWEHRLVRADDLSRVGMAFFNMNGVVSVVYLATVVAAVLAPRWLQG